MMIVREPPPSRMRELRAKINVRQKPRPTVERVLAAPDEEAAEPDSEIADEERLAEALRGTFPASDPPASWAG